MKGQAQPHTFLAVELQDEAGGDALLDVSNETSKRQFTLVR